MRCPPLVDDIDGVKTLCLGDFARGIRVSVPGKHECSSCLIDFFWAVLWSYSCHSTILVGEYS